MSKFVLSAFADEIDADLKTQMDVLDQHGIKFIEMRGVNGKSFVQHSLEEAKDIKKQLDERGFKLSAVGSPIGKVSINDSFEPHLELFKHTIKLAQIMETKYIRIFSFYIPKGEELSKYRPAVMDRFSSFMEAVKGTDLMLLHENEKDIYGETPECCLDIIKTMGSDQLRATFDPANFIQCNCEAYPKSFNMLKDYIEYLHIKDARIIDNQIVPSGQGDGKVYEILSELKKSGFEGFLSIEPHLGNFVGFADLEKNSPGFDLPNGGPKQFAIATNALKKVLAKLD